MTARINRFRFTEKSISQIKNYLKGKSKTEPNVLKKFKGEIKGNTLYIDDKRVIEKSNVDEYLRQKIYEGKTSLSRDGAFYLISKEVVGVPRKTVETFLRKQRIVRATDNQQPTTKRGSRKVHKVGQYHLDLIEIKWKDLPFEPDEMPKNIGDDGGDGDDDDGDDDDGDDDELSKGYILSLVDALTSLGFFKFHAKKTQAQVTPIVKEGLEYFKKKLGVPLSKGVIISDRGNEFSIKTYQSWGVRTRYVKRSSIVESKNSMFQRSLYKLAKMKKTKNLHQLVKDTMDVVNNTVSRLTKQTPLENAAGDKTEVAKKYNKNRGKDVEPRIRALKKGDRVRIQKLSDKDKGIGFKAYKAELWSKQTYTVQARRGQRYLVNKKYYHRDQLRLTPEADKKSEELLKQRQTKQHKKEDAETARVRKQTDTAPRRRSTRAASKKALEKMRAQHDKWKRFDRKYGT
jgi:hypothetical protein